MKFHVNILLKIVILLTIVIPPETCQEETSMNETLIDEISSNETSSNETSDEGPVLDVIPYSIFYFPDKDVESSWDCEEGRKKDTHGKCRKILS